MAGQTTVNPKTALRTLNQIMESAPYAISDAIDFFMYQNSPQVFRSHENCGTFQMFKEDNFITRCCEPSGEHGKELFRLSYKKFSSEVDRELISIKPSMANMIIDAMNKDGLTHISFESKAQGEGPMTYIMSGREDHESREKIVSDFNRNMYFSREFSPQELLENFKDTNFVRIDRIEKDVFEQLDREKALLFPHDVRKTIKGNALFYSISVPSQYKDRMEMAVAKTSLFLSGSTKEISRQYHQERKDTLESIYKALGDNKKSFIVIDSANPDMRIMSEKNMIAVYRADKREAGIALTKTLNTKESHAELFGKLDKMAGSKWQSDLHKELSRYKAPVLIENNEKALDKIKEYYDREGQTKTLKSHQAMSTKYHFANSLCSLTDREGLIRAAGLSEREQREGIFYKDNQIRFANGIDHAIILKDDNLKYDLQSDKDLNERGKGGLTQVIDYSDLCDAYANDYRESTAQEHAQDEKERELDAIEFGKWKAEIEYSKALCERLGLTHESQSEEERESTEEKMKNSYGFRQLISVQRDVREFVLKDMEASLIMTRTIEPREIIREDFELELSEESRTIGYAIEEQEHEFDM